MCARIFFIFILYFTNNLIISLLSRAQLSFVIRMLDDHNYGIYIEPFDVRKGTRY